MLHKTNTLFFLDAEFVKSKNQSIAWFVSNCDTPSQRMEYVRALQKHIKVDIYGECGNLKCPRSQENNCWTKVDQLYHFYLAFENSICKDYVTEKFFNALEHNVVPIVLGGANYSGIAPQKSYIDAWNDYKDPADLARFLKDLIDDRSSYAEYFWWKKHYKIIDTDSHSIARYQCQVCEKLNQKKNQAKNNNVSYEDLYEWWDHQSRCKKVRIRSH